MKQSQQQESGRKIVAQIVLTLTDDGVVGVLQRGKVDQLWPSMEDAHIIKQLLSGSA